MDYELNQELELTLATGHKVTGKVIFLDPHFNRVKIEFTSGPLDGDFTYIPANGLDKTQ